MPERYDIQEYLAEDGRCPFQEWLIRLRDRRARARVRARLDRVALGNLGDSKPVGEGVQELRVFHGPGYRIYFGLDGDTVVLLLCGGIKATQDRDIRAAQTYWRDYRSRDDA